MARPIGTDSTRTGGTFVPGPVDRYVLQEMLVSVREAAAEPLSGKRYAIRDPLTMETLGHSGMRTVKPDWMRDAAKGGKEYFGTEETEKTLTALLDGTWPKTAKRDRIAEAIDTALHSDAELEKGRAFGAGVDPHALPTAGETEAVPFDVPALPTSRPRVGLDDDTGTLVLSPRSPLKGRFTTVNPPAKSKHELALFASQEYREQRRKGLTPTAASAEATRQVWEHFPREARRFGVPAPVSVQGSLFTVPRTIPRGGLRPRGTQAADLGPLFGGGEGPGLFGNPGGAYLGSQHFRMGDRVTFLDRFNQRRTGRVVFAFPSHLTLNMGGRYGTPAVVHYGDVVKVQPRRNPPGLDLDVDAPDKVPPVLARASDAYGESAGELSAAWQDPRAGRPWEKLATVLDRAAAAARKAVGANPLTRTETAAVLGRARMARKLARTFAGWPEGVAKAAQSAALVGVARDFGQAGGPKGRAARRAVQYGPAAPGDPDYQRNVPAHVLDAGWRAHRAAKKAGASEADAKAAGLRAVWAAYPAEAAAWGIPRPNPPRVLGPIPGRMREIRYQRTGKDRGPYFHKFGPNVRAFACADGSVILRGPRPLFVNQ